MASFVKDSFRFTTELTELLGNDQSGTLRCFRDEVEQHLRETHEDIQRNVDLRPCPKNVEVAPPEIAMDSK